MKRFIPPSVPFTEKWSIEMKKVLSVVSLIMGIVPFSLLFIWKHAFCTLCRSQMRFRAVALRSITAARF